MRPIGKCARASVTPGRVHEVCFACCMLHASADNRAASACIAQSSAGRRRRRGDECGSLAMEMLPIYWPSSRLVAQWCGRFFFCTSSAAPSRRDA
eukprot:2904850-Pleurochrysis_carterae.AAC.1